MLLDLLVVELPVARAGAVVVELASADSVRDSMLDQLPDFPVELETFLFPDRSGEQSHEGTSLVSFQSAEPISLNSAIVATMTIPTIALPARLPKIAMAPAFAVLPLFAPVAAR